MKKERLPKRLQNIYLFAFLLPLAIIFLQLLFFKNATVISIFVVGSIFIIGELAFISKAEYEKKEWFYSSIIFLFECFVLLIIYFKII